MSKKNEILERLYKAGHISFEELMILGSGSYIPEQLPYPAPAPIVINPSPYVYPYNPYAPIYNPYIVTCDSSGTGTICTQTTVKQP
mgnify:CR=1 FL=1